MSDKELANAAKNKGVKPRYGGYEYPTENSPIINRVDVIDQLLKTENQKNTGWLFVITIFTLVLNLFQQ